MGIVQVQLPEELKSLVDRQIAESRVASEAEFFVEAARRFIADLAAEDAIVSEAEAGIAEAEAGIADAEAGRYVAISSPRDVEALRERTMARLRDRLAADFT